MCAMRYPVEGTHIHGEGCGHTAVQHDDHLGHIVDGKLHCLVPAAKAEGKSSDDAVVADTADKSGKGLIFVHHAIEETSVDDIQCDAAQPSKPKSDSSSSGVPLALDQSSSSSPRDPKADGNDNANAGDRGVRENLSCEDHEHGPDCGHEQIQHGDHFDYLVGDTLHHRHDGHCDKHRVGIRSVAEMSSPTLARQGYAKFVGDDDDDLVTDDESTADGLKRRRDLSTFKLVDVASPPFYADRDSLRFIVMFILVGGYFFVELIWGIRADSLALVADALHMLSDFIALCVGYYSLRTSRRTRSETATFGMTRMEVVGGLMNGCFLLAIAFTIVLEALERLIDPHTESNLAENAQTLLYVAGAGLVLNVVGLFVFGHGHGGGHGHSHGPAPAPVEEAAPGSGNDNDGTSENPKITNFNIRAVFLHVMGDALGSVAVMISASIIAFTDWPNKLLADPLCSMVIAFIIFGSTVPLVKATAQVLLQKVPSTVNLSSLQRQLMDVTGVEEIHELHVWQLNLTKAIASLHVILKPSTDFMKISDKLKKIMHAHGIHSTTIQPEYRSNLAAINNAENCSDRICAAPACTKNACCAPGQLSAHNTPRPSVAADNTHLRAPLEVVVKGTDGKS